MTLFAKPSKRKLKGFWFRFFVSLMLAFLGTPKISKAANLKCESLLTDLGPRYSKVGSPSAGIIKPSHFDALTQKIRTLVLGSNRLNDLLDSDAGVMEGYSVQEHNERVFEVYLRKRESALPLLQEILNRSPEDLDLFLTTVIILHDIGKPLALAEGHANRQHEFTLPLLSETMKKLGWSSQEIALARALVGHDLIGKYMKGTSDVFETLRALSTKARSIDVPLNQFFSLQKLFFEMDAGSYPYLQKLLFEASIDGALQFKPGRMNVLSRLAKRKNFEKIYQSVKTPTKLDQQRRLWMRRQELLFETLFDRLNFESYQTFETKLKNQIRNLKDFFSRAPVDGQKTHILNRIEDFVAGSAEIRIRTSTQYLNSILTEGYRNKAEAGEGSLQSSFSGDLQDLVEASFLGVHPDKMAAIPSEIRPRFGFLAPSPTSKSFVGVRIDEVMFRDLAPDQVSSHPHLRELGNVTIILNLKDYEDALTLTAGDSANTLQENEHVGAPDQLSYHKPEAWDQIYVPWKYRLVFHKNLKGQNYTWDSFKGNFEFSLEGNQELHNEEVALNKMGETLFSVGLGPKVEYFEAQIWKPIQKIQAVEIRPDQELSLELRNLLKSQGIEVRVSP